MNRYALSLVVLMLGGCATAYKPEGHGGGFTDTKFGPNLFAVTVRANGFTSAERAAEIALLRSSELTLKNGFTHFIIVEKSQGASTSSFTMPTTTYTTGNVNLVGNTAYLNSRSTTSGGETLNVSKPRVHYKIECYRGQPDRKLGLAYDARAVCESLEGKFGASCERLEPTATTKTMPPVTSSDSEDPASLATLPPGWRRTALTDALAKKGASAYVVNKTIDAGALVVLNSKADIVDMALHAKSLRAKQIGQIGQGEWSEITQVSVKGRRAWRFWVSGVLKEGMSVKYMGTLIEGDRQVIYVTAWTSTQNFEDSRASMEMVSDSFADL